MDARLLTPLPEMCDPFFTPQSMIAIEEENFVLSRAQRDLIYRKMERLQEKSPSGAFLSLDLKFTQHTYEGELKILSPGGQFISKDRSPTLNGLYLKLEEDIKYQLKRWKRKRFLQSVDTSKGHTGDERYAG